METEVLAKLQEGDEKAWCAFWDDYQPLIRSVAQWRKWNFSDETRNDVIQDIFAELPRVIGSFRGDSSFEYFIKRICIHRCIDRLRKEIREKSRYESLIDTDGEGQPVERDVVAGDDFDPVQAVQRRERAEQLMRRVEELDETCRIAIVYFYNEGLSYKQIAEKLEVTVNAVGSRLAKCLAKLRDMLIHDNFFGEYSGRGDRQDRKKQEP